MIKRTLKFCTFIICALFWAFNSYCATGTDVKFTFLDKESKQPIPGIRVDTTNTRAVFSGTSDENGVAIVLPKSEKNAPYENLCRMFINQSDARTGKGIKLCATDTEDVYASDGACVIITNNTGCNIKMLLNKKTSKKNYPSPEAIAEMALTRGGNLKFYPACDKTFTDYPSKITPDKRHCVNDFFKNTKVQMLAAEELAKLYAMQQHDQLIECDILYETRGGDDFLKCIGIDNVKDETHAYEFRFRNLNAPVGATQAHGVAKIQHSTADAICRLPGGEYYSDTSSCSKQNDKKETEQMCTTINTYATRFGWNAIYDSFLPNEGGYDLGYKLCLFDFNIKQAGNYKFRTYGDIDPYIFQNMTVQSNRDLVLLLNQYVRFKTTEEFKQLECDASFTRYRKSYYFDSYTDAGQIVSCHLTTIDNKKHDIDFLFKTVNETGKTASKDGKAGMTCIASGGNFDGKNCTAIGQIQCKALGAGLAGGAIWDEKLGICRMPDSYTARDMENAINKAKMAGSILVGVVLTAATAGVGTFATTAIIAWVATGAGAVASVEMELLQDNQNSLARDFVAAASLCPHASNCSKNECTYTCNPESNCAKDTLISAYKYIPKMLKSDGDSENENQLSNAVSLAHDTVLKKLTAQCVDNEFAKTLTTTTSELQDKIEFYSTLGVVAGAVGAAADFYDLRKISKQVGNIGKITSASSKTSKILIRDAKAEETMSKILGLVADNAYNAGASTEIGDPFTQRAREELTHVSDSMSFGDAKETLQTITGIVSPAGLPIKDIIKSRD